MNTIVIGLGFGDEGKGKVVNYFTEGDKTLVIRHSGGHQVGHTVLENDIEHIFSNFGSGTLKGAATYFSEYCTVDPVGFLNEFEVLNKKGISNVKVYYHPLCKITTPWDIFYNKVESQFLRNGTTGTGFGATIQRCEDNYNLFISDIFNKDVLNIKIEEIINYYSRKEIYLENHKIEDFKNKIRIFKDLIEVRNLFEIKDNFNQFIFEGSQGILLDQNHGFFPYVTRANTTSKNALKIAEENNIQIDSITYVSRTYLTRHGNGYFPNENIQRFFDTTNKENEFQGVMKFSKLDKGLLNHSLLVDRIYSKDIAKNIVFNHCDENPIVVETFVDNHQKYKIYLGTNKKILKLWN